MRKIDISANATETEVAGKFKGIITFKNKFGDVLVFDYIWKMPEEDGHFNTIDIEFSNKNEKFFIKETPSLNLLEQLTSRQNIILGLSIMVIPKIMSCSKISKKRQCSNLSMEIEQYVYELIFGK